MASTSSTAWSVRSIPEVVIERVWYLENRFQVADDTTAVTRQLIKLLENFKIGGKQVHDANIVAAMLAFDIPCLLTYNIKDFERLGMPSSNYIFQ